MFTFHCTLGQIDTSPNIILQPSGIGQNTVGQQQDVICSISLPPDIDPNTVVLSWVNKDDIITDDNRVTIIEPLNGSANNMSNSNTSVITTVIRFDPLIENDQGTYSCYLIVNGSETFASIQLQNFISKQIVIFVCTYVHVNYATVIDK